MIILSHSFLFFLTIFFLSWLFTWFVYRYALRRNLFVLPNERSSHTVPTPRGGGIGIALALLGAMSTLWFFDIIPPELAVAFIGGGAMIVTVGWIDDRRHLSISVRLLIQFLAAGWALFFIGGIDRINIGIATVPLGWLSHLLPLSMVWIMNLYNFMDGIDGLASSEAVLVGVVGGVLLTISGAQDLAFLSFALSAAAAGFLVWNWQPARIFMGDSGSVLIGFIFAALFLASERSGIFPGLLWILLLLIFIIDPTYTTIRRFLKGEKWFAAHRVFAFQQFVRRGYSHQQTTLGILGIDGVLVLLTVLSWWKPILLLPSFFFSLFLLSLFWWRIQRITR